MTPELMQQYTEKSKIKDANLKGVINCNLLAWKNEHEDFHEAIKILDECMSLEAKVSRAQLILLKINKCSYTP